MRGCMEYILSNLHILSVFEKNIGQVADKSVIC